MHFFAKIFGKLALNALILYGATNYFPGFTLSGGANALFTAAVVITLLNIFVKPVFRFLATPLVWMTFGLFLIVINIATLWIADLLLSSIAFADYSTLVILSIIIGVVNSFL